MLSHMLFELLLVSYLLLRCFVSLFQAMSINFLPDETVSDYREGMEYFEEGALTSLKLYIQKK